MGRSIRFGARIGNLRSGTFVVVSSSTTTDIYILCRAVGRQARVSLHQSGSWRLNVEPIHAETGEVMPPVHGETWTRPAPFAEGLTKVFGVVVPAAGVTLPITDHDADVRFIQVPRGAWGIQFTLILSEPGTPARSWPGADAMSTTLIGNVKLTSGETLWVVAHPITDSPMPAGLPMTAQLLPGQDMEAVKDALAQRSFRALTLVIGEDGMRGFMETAIIPKEESGQEGV